MSHGAAVERSARAFCRPITLAYKRHQIFRTQQSLRHQPFSQFASSRDQNDGAKTRKQTRNEFYAAPVRPTAIWLSPSGEKLDAQQIVRQLPSLGDYLREDLTSAIFFVTPQLAHLFEPGANFYASAMRHIWPRHSLPEKGGKRQSYVAVVDALPAITHQSIDGRPEVYGYEGIAVMLSPDPKVQIDDGKSDESMPLVSLTSQQPVKKIRDLLAVTYSAPVANTLFVNGRKHTMFRDRWSNDKQKLYDDGKRQYLSHLDIPIYRTSWNKEVPAALNAKLIKLTKPAVIVSSMGNIIRQIQTEDGKVLAASHELEQVLPPYVKKMQTENPLTEVRVFAFIYPPNPVGKVPYNSFQERIFYPVRSSRSKIGLKRSHLQAMLIRGARIYRVTSGGAGWGKKAGLLSLEPITQLNARPEQELSMFPSFDLEEDSDSLSRPEDLFPPGHIVQFLASWHDTNGTDKDGISISDIPNDAEWLQEHYFSPRKLQKLCIGTTIQQESWGPAKTQPQTEANEKLHEALFCPNRFGLLTNSAMSISVTKMEPQSPMEAAASSAGDADLASLIAPARNTARGGQNPIIHSTLVEIPNSSVTATFSAGGELIELPETTGTPEQENNKQHPKNKRKPFIRQSPNRLARRHSSMSVRKADARQVIAETISIRKMDHADARMGNIPKHRKVSEGNWEENLYWLHRKNIREGKHPVLKTVDSKSALFDHRKKKMAEKSIEELMKGI